MNEEIDDLKKEIFILKKKISILEKKERNRNATKLIKFIVKIAFYSLVLFGLWKTYDYIVHEIPNMVTEEVDNKSKDLSNKIKEIWPFK